MKRRLALLCLAFLLLIGGCGGMETIKLVVDAPGTDHARLCLKGPAGDSCSATGFLFVRLWAEGQDVKWQAQSGLPEEGRLKFPQLEALGELNEELAVSLRGDSIHLEGKEHHWVAEVKSGFVVTQDDHGDFQLHRSRGDSALPLSLKSAPQGISFMGGRGHRYLRLKSTEVLGGCIHSVGLGSGSSRAEGSPSEDSLPNHGGDFPIDSTVLVVILDNFSPKADTPLGDSEAAILFCCTAFNPDVAVLPDPNIPMFTADGNLLELQGTLPPHSWCGWIEAYALYVHRCINGVSTPYGLQGCDLHLYLCADGSVAFLLESTCPHEIKFD